MLFYPWHFHLQMGIWALLVYLILRPFGGRREKGKERRVCAWPEPGGSFSRVLQWNCPHFPTVVFTAEKVQPDDEFSCLAWLLKRSLGHSCEPHDTVAHRSNKCIRVRFVAYWWSSPAAVLVWGEEHQICQSPCFPTPGAVLREEVERWKGWLRVQPEFGVCFHSVKKFCAVPSGWELGYNLRTRSSCNPGSAISSGCSIFVPASSSVALGSGGKANPEDYFEN